MSPNTINKPHRHPWNDLKYLIQSNPSVINNDFFKYIASLKMFIKIFF